MQGQRVHTARQLFLQDRIYGLVALHCPRIGKGFRCHHDLEVALGSVGYRMIVALVLNRDVLRIEGLGQFLLDGLSHGHSASLTAVNGWAMLREGDDEVQDVEYSVIFQQHDTICLYPHGQPLLATCL